MKEKVITLYEFDELSDQAKETARDWWRSCIDTNDYGAVIEDAVRMADLMGIKITHERNTPCIYWSGFSSQGDGACFEGSYSYKKGAVKAILAETGAGREDASKGDRELLRIAKGLQEVQRSAFYRLTAHVERGHNSNYYSHSGTMAVTVYRNYEDATDAQEEEITQLMKDFADWIYSQLDAENDYLYSEENVDEAIRINEYTFTEDGKRED